MNKGGLLRRPPFYEKKGETNNEKLDHVCDCHRLSADCNLPAASVFHEVSGHRIGFGDIRNYPVY